LVSAVIGELLICSASLLSFFAPLYVASLCFLSLSAQLILILITTTTIRSFLLRRLINVFFVLMCSSYVCPLTLHPSVTYNIWLWREGRERDRKRKKRKRENKERI